MSIERPHREWSAEKIMAYHQAKLSDEDRYHIEADAIEDPFLADALEGAAGFDMVDLKEELDVSWSTDGPVRTLPKGKRSWNWLLYSSLAILSACMIYHAWNGQRELSALHDALIAEKEQSESDVYRYQDSLKLLEITLAQKIPDKDQIDAELAIADQQIQLYEMVSAPELFENDEALERLDTISSLGAGRKPKAHNAKLNVEEFPSTFILGLKVADYRDDHKELEFIQVPLLKRTPAALEYKKEGSDDIGFRLTYHSFLTKAIGAFSAGDYKNCLVILDRISEKYPRDENAKFYSGLCYYNIGKWERATVLFREVQFHEHKVFNEESEFYRALSKLRSGDEHEAQRMLRSIVDRDSFYAQRALTYLVDKNIAE